MNNPKTKIILHNQSNYPTLVVIICAVLFMVAFFNTLGLLLESRHNENFVGELLMGIIGSLAFGSVLVTRNYLVYDFESKKATQYKMHFGFIKTGISEGNFPYLSVLYSKKKALKMSRSNLSFADTLEYYTVYLMDKNHQRKMPLKLFDTKSNALDYAQSLSNTLGIEVVDFKPVISAETMKKRRL
jgi:hypothetical protein